MKHTSPMKRKTRVYGIFKKRVWVDPADFEMDLVDDPYPDLSWLGEFSDTPAEDAIFHSDDRREYKWFNPATEYGRQDYERMMEYQRGEVVSYGIRAKVSIIIPLGFVSVYDPMAAKGHRKDPYYVTETIDTAGLWGVESDSGEYIDEVYEQECHELIIMLEKMGIRVGEPRLQKIYRIAGERLAEGGERVGQWLKAISGRLDTLVEQVDTEKANFNG